MQRGQLCRPVADIKPERELVENSGGIAVVPVQMNTCVVASRRKGDARAKEVSCTSRTVARIIVLVDFP